MTTILRGWKLDLSVDLILRAQGADPDVIRSRKPKLVDVAERALAEGLALIEPAVAYRLLKIQSVQHNRILLEENLSLTGKLIAAQLARAKQVVAMICTAGDALERLSLEMISRDAVYGLALYGLGSAAVENLATLACRHFGGEFKKQGLETTIPLSPGMEGWDTQAGQLQIFKIVDGRAIGVTLSSSAMMMPRKSLTQVLGAGEDVDTTARICDFCAQRLTCRYQDQNH